VGTSRVDLQVPFAEKDDAKRLGARWDGGQRTWCIPEGNDPSPLKQWLSQDQPPNIRAPRWELAISPRECSVLLGYLEAVPAEVTAQLRRLAPHYRLDHSQTTESFYWLNHCEHCEAKLGDFDTIAESGS